MDLRHLRYFQAVAEELSYSRAARRVRVAQPALSRAVVELEKELGAAVLERSRHHVRLTPAGVVLLAEISVLFERLEEGVQRVRRTASGQEGELRLGYIGPPTAAFLGPLLREYRRRYPGVSLHLEERTPERVWEMVAKGRLSMALTRPVAGQERWGMRMEVLWEDTLGVMIPADHRWAERRRLAWRALAAESLVILARREGISSHDAIVSACGVAGFVPRVVHQPSLIGTVLAYVQAGAGVGVVPESVSVGQGWGRFVPLTPRRAIPLVLAWKEAEAPPAVRCFRELVMEWRDRGGLREAVGMSGRFPLAPETARVPA